MRTLLYAFLLAAGAVVAPAAADTALTGNWQIKRIAAERESQLECSFTQKGAELTGSCNSERGTMPITGKVDGTKANWSHKSESEGGTVTVEYTGTIESATKITGKVLAVEFSIEGEFTATRVK